MDAIILLAGMGRRMGSEGEISHKTMTLINGKPIISYILDNIYKAGIRSIVPVLGYKSDEVRAAIEKYWPLGPESIRFVYNDKFSITNNLYSLWAGAKDINDDFTVMNGDMIYDYRILKELVDAEPGTYLSIDTVHKADDIDSPGVEIEGEFLTNWERRMSPEKRDGYATGVYRIGMDFKDEYYELSQKMLAENLQCTYGDPLTVISQKKKIIRFISTKDYYWTDVDEIGDIERAEDYLNKIEASLSEEK